MSDHYPPWTARPYSFPFLGSLAAFFIFIVRRSFIVFDLSPFPFANSVELGRSEESNT